MEVKENQKHKKNYNKMMEDLFTSSALTYGGENSDFIEFQDGQYVVNLLRQITL